VDKRIVGRVLGCLSDAAMRRIDSTLERAMGL
jgi:hypothetical protein